MDTEVLQDLQAQIDKAETLIEALPYLQDFRGKVMVVKYGGSTMGSGDTVTQGHRLYAGGRHLSGRGNTAVARPLLAAYRSWALRASA